MKRSARRQRRAGGRRKRRLKALRRLSRRREMRRALRSLADEEKAAERCPAPWIHRATTVGRKCAQCGRKVLPELEAAP